MKTHSTFIGKRSVDVTPILDCAVLDCSRATCPISTQENLKELSENATLRICGVFRVGSATLSSVKLTHINSVCSNATDIGHGRFVSASSNMN